MHRLAATTALALLLGTPAAAQCLPDDPAAGGAVVCMGTDTDGFQSEAPRLDVTVLEDASVVTSNEDAIRLEGEGTRVVNRGRIESAGADGIEVASGEIVNDGTIDAATGAGIVVGPAEADLVILNDGTIRGDTGIQAGTGTPGDAANVRRQIVSNSGLIEGTGGVALDLGAGDDVLNLFGDAELIGDVLLGEGDDTLIFTDVADDDLVGDLFDGGAGFDTWVFASLNSTDVDVVSFIDLVLFLTVDLPGNPDAADVDVRLINFESIAFVDVTQSVDDLVPPVAPVPLPAGGALLLGALGLLGMARRKG